MTTSTFQLGLNTTTGEFTLGEIDGPLELDGFSIQVPADTSSAEIEILRPAHWNFKKMTIWVKVTDPPPEALKHLATISVVPETADPITLFSFDHGGRSVSLQLTALTGTSVTFTNTNETGGTEVVEFGFSLDLVNSGGIVYTTNDLSIIDQAAP